MEYIFYPHWTNSDRLLIKIGQTGLDLNEVDREFAKLVPPPPPEVKTNLVLMICFFDKHPVCTIFHFVTLPPSFFFNTFRKINVIIPAFWPLILMY